MKIITKKNKNGAIIWGGDHKRMPMWKVYAVDNDGKVIFGADESVQYDTEYKQFVPHIGSCNGSMEHAEIRLKVIKKCYTIARRENKKLNK